MKRANVHVCAYFGSGLFSSFFGEQGSDKVRLSSRTLKLLEQFDVQIQGGFC
jgi:hypothetical protein